MSTTSNLSAAALTALTVLALAACGSETRHPSSADASPDAATTTAAASALALDKGWAKATGGHMTGAFGVLRNAGSSDLHVVSASSPAASEAELHDTVKNESGQMQMQEVTSGFTIPGGQSLELKPGGRHIMLMGVRAPLENGTSVAVTLSTLEGYTVTVDLPVREFAGAEETYVPGVSTSPSS